MIRNHSHVAAAVAAGAYALGLAVPPAFAEDTAPLPTPSTSTTKPAGQSSETAPGTKHPDSLPASHGPVRPLFHLLLFRPV